MHWTMCRRVVYRQSKSSTSCDRSIALLSQEWERTYPEAAHKLRLLLLSMDNSGRLFKVCISIISAPTVSQNVQHNKRALSQLLLKGSMDDHRESLDDNPPQSETVCQAQHLLKVRKTIFSARAIHHHHPDRVCTIVGRQWRCIVESNRSISYAHRRCQQEQ